MRRSLTAATALLALLAHAPLAAQEHAEGGGGGGLLSVNPGLTIWTIIVFVVVLGILSRTAYPAILGAVEKREAHLRDLAEAAEKDRAEAAALAEENRRLLDETRGRVQEALAEARTQAERMRAEAMDEARAEREALLARATQDVATEREMAVATVQREAVEIALKAAEKLVRRNLDSDDNRSLVRDYLGQMQASAPAGA